MPDMNENAETQQEYFGKSKIETDYKDLSMRLYKQIADLEAQIEKMKCCSNCGKEFTKECAWWKRAEENRQINTCKDWEIKEK